MRMLCCGDRNWTNRTVIENVLALYGPEVVIEGGCRGADLLAAEVAREMGIRVEEYPADWKKYGRTAGPIRNKQMLDEGRPNIIVAFHQNIEESKGTKNMMQQAEAAGIETRVFQVQI